MCASKVTVTKQFSDDFELVATHYKLKELGQYDEAKKAARADLDTAIVTFASLAQEVRYQPDDYDTITRDELNGRFL